MPAKLTRLELVIIVAALVVLVFSNRPPESGNAEIRTGIEQTTDTSAATLPPQSASSQPGTTPTTDSSELLQIGTMPDNPPAESVPQPQPKAKRIAMIDARRCDSLKYPDIMYGEITVRWIWNGTKFEAHRVCEVKESNGIVTVWSLDERHEGVTITPLPPDQTPMY